LDILDTSKYTLSCATKTLPISVKLLNEQQMMRKGKKRQKMGKSSNPFFYKSKFQSYQVLAPNPSIVTSPSLNTSK